MQFKQGLICIELGENAVRSIIFSLLSSKVYGNMKPMTLQVMPFGKTHEILKGEKHEKS